MIHPVKGTRDLIYPETEAWRSLEETAHRVLRLFGFTEIRTPVIERTELFARSIGDETDIVTKEMYTFADRKGRSLTLRPENTAGVIRSYVSQGLASSPVHQRLYYIGPQFRYERPQAGRQRQFHQLGAEVIGEEAPSCDAEVISSVMVLLSELGLGGLGVQINSVGCPDCRPAYVEAIRKSLGPVKENLCGDCRRRLDTNPLRTLDCKVPSCQPLLAAAPAFTDHLCAGCARHHEGLLEALGILRIPADENPRLVRGLDYYTRTVFEITARTGGAQDAILGGGRYDSLVQELGGPALPAFGYAVGLERLLLALERDERPRPAALYLAWLGETVRLEALRMAGELRHRGISVLMEHTPRSLKSSLKRAARMGIRWALIAGEDETKAGAFPLRNLDTSTQESFTLERIAEILTDRERSGPEAAATPEEDAP